MEPKFKRVLLKLSGEGLLGDKQFGISETIIDNLTTEIATIHNLGIKLCIVVGGGNIFRGAKNATAEMDRSVADKIGMMATIINALTLKSSLDAKNIKTIVYSGLEIPQVCETYNFEKAIDSFNCNKVIIFAGGTGCPYFTTDTGAVLRAVEMHCDVVMKATQVDGVYDADPRYNNDAKRYDEISYSEVIAKHLNVMDMSAIALAQDNNLPIMVFAQKEKNSIVNAVCGSAKYTLIK